MKLEVFVRVCSHIAASLMFVLSTSLFIRQPIFVRYTCGLGHLCMAFERDNIFNKSTSFAMLRNEVRVQLLETRSAITDSVGGGI